MTELRTITLLDGKYTMRQTDVDGITIWDKPLRYGEVWRAHLDQGPTNLECALADYVLELQAELRELIDSMRCDKTIVKHRKGGTYEVIGIGDTQNDSPMPDNSEVVIYRSLEDGLLWARAINEFTDGRFEHVSGPNIPAPAPVAIPETPLKPGEVRNYPFRFKDLETGLTFLHYAPNRHEALVWASANSISHFEDRYEFLGQAV